MLCPRTGCAHSEMCGGLVIVGTIHAHEPLQRSTWRTSLEDTFGSQTLIWPCLWLAQVIGEHVGLSVRDSVH